MKWIWVKGNIFYKKNELVELGKAESFKARELFCLDLFAFTSSICCSNRQCYSAFVISLEFAGSISSLRQLSERRDLVVSSFRRYEMTHL